MNRIRDWYDRDRGPSRNFNDHDRYGRDDRNDRYDRDDRYDRPIDRSFDHERDDVRGRDFGWRGTELDRGFGPGSRYDQNRSDFDDRSRFFDRDRGPDRNHPQPYRGNPQPYRNDFDNRPRMNDWDRNEYRGDDRYRDDDRYRSASGDPYLDRGYERDRDRGRDEERDRERGRDFWDNAPWSNRRY